MTRALFVCDGAAPPREIRSGPWDVSGAINHTGRQADLNLRIQNLIYTLPGAISGRAADLVRIASYVYAADQMISRGGETDLWGDRWLRTFVLVIPVTDRQFWSQPSVESCLREALSWVSGDNWGFFFTAALRTHEQLPMETEPGAPVRYPDCVALFSGGSDSLCAIVQAAQNGRKPALISHSPTPMHEHRQKELAKALRIARQGWQFPHTDISVNRIGSPPKDSTQRTRSFLFACLGAALAQAVGVRDVLLPDNGIASLNMRINDQLVGTLATRSTHPKFIGLMNALLAATFDDPPVIQNPLALSTRAESLDLLKRAGVERLLAVTNSCAYPRGRPNALPHCGLCSQCVDRRFASIAAGLEEHDLPEQYGKDIFREELKEGPGRVLARSYVTWARRIAATATDEEVVLDYPELADAILPGDPDPDGTARALVQMVRRQSGQILSALESQVDKAKRDLVFGTLPDGCLLRIALGPETGRFPTLAAARPVSLDANEEREFQECGFQSRLRIDITGKVLGRRRNLVLLQGAPVHIEDADFVLLLRLVVALHEFADGYVSIDDLENDYPLGRPDVTMPLIYQHVWRLRRPFRGRLGDLDEKRFVEERRKRVRLSTPGLCLLGRGEAAEPSRRMRTIACRSAFSLGQRIGGRLRATMVTPGGQIQPRVLAAERLGDARPRNAFQPGKRGPVGHGISFEQILPLGSEQLSSLNSTLAHVVSDAPL